MSTKVPQRFVFLTAGAGGMFCGSCMHDNTLARAMLKRGLDVQLVPVYTPIRTDEQDVTVDQVFFGGINIYLQQRIPMFRHLPRLLDRMLDSPWLIRKLTSTAIKTDPRDLGSLTVSMLRGLAGNQRKEVRRLTEWLRSHGRPQMLLLSNMLIAGAVPTWKEELGVPIVALLQGDDAFLDYIPSPYREQATDAIRNLAKQVDGFLCHSDFYAERMAERFDLPRDRITVTPLGIDVSDFSSIRRVSHGQLTPTIGYLARLSPEKGFHLLVDAFIQLSEQTDRLKPRLLIAGWLSPQHREFVDTQFAKLKACGLESRYEYRGVVNRTEKCALLAECDVFSVPTEVPEPKGLYALEAMAAGVPVVLPAEGVFPELLGAAGTGWQFPARDTRALTEMLHQVLTDTPQRIAAAEKGRQFVLEHRNAERTAEETIRALNQIWQASPVPV